MTNDAVEINSKVLDKLLKILREDKARVQVGILGDSKARTTKESGPSNAEIGAKYEFKKSSNLPGGSFLRVPITDNLQKYFDDTGAFDKKALESVVKEGNFTPWLKLIGVIAETIVSDAFKTAGFGKWKPSNMKYKKNKQTLVETTQLRDSIMSKVVE